MGKNCIWATILGLVLLLAGSGCGRTEAEVHTEAILRVLLNDKALSAKLQTAIPTTTTVEARAALLDEYCRGLDEFDMSECPPDFRLAFRHHIEAWRSAASKLREMPDGFWEGVLMGAVNSLSGEMDGGAGRLNSEMQQAQRAIKETYQEAERIAAKYGAVL